MEACGFVSDFVGGFETVLPELGCHLVSGTQVPGKDSYCRGSCVPSEEARDSSDEAAHCTSIVRGGPVAFRLDVLPSREVAWGSWAH